MSKETNTGDDVRAALDLTIDENNLLNEWQGQASMMLDYGIQLADAMQEEDETKAKLAVVAAELDRDIRSDPAEYGLTKATETTVLNAINEQPEHQIAAKKLNDARYKVRVFRAAVDALSHRKSTLQGMTDLFLRQWYADPRSPDQPAELKEAADGPPTKTITGRRKRRASNKEG
jgi:hypothetical protein